jgi:phage host-nuclease inhibitor protein Gam
MSTNPLPNVSRREAEQAVLQVIQSRSALDKLESDKRVKIARIDQDFSLSIDQQTEQLQAAQQTVKRYLEQHRDELLTEGSRSVKIVGATVGYRSGSERVELLDEVSEADLLQRLASDRRLAKTVLKTKTSLDRKALLGHAKALTAEEQRALGVRVTRSETFYIK